jgi:intron-binding protein aquarius
MEEAAQVLEVETLIPMLLQNTDHVLASIVINSSQGSNNSRLKRVTLVGDHFQLPPIIQHMSLVGYSKFDQSLFTRLIRLGVPAILLDQQGRARPEIAALYNWRYNSNSQTLANLPTIYNSKRFKVCNPGLLFTYQLINVEDFQGKGETAPTPYFYQNLGEAEYVVAVYQYMRLRGYPANKISILTTYNGQKHLINDVIHRRCKHPLFGRPGRVSTVDKYQGQQNDYVLLSLVRTESVGHLRDIRRLIVAFSRARFGLYIFCRHSLFSSCPELKNIFNMFTENGKRPNILQLVNGEEYNVMDEYESDEMSTDMETWRTVDDRVSGDRIQTIENVTRMGVLVYEAVQGSKK